MDVHRLDTRDKPGLLAGMMSALASDATNISFEGRLSNTELVQMEGVTFEETGVLKRATLAPTLDFLVLPLTHQTLPVIAKAITLKIAFGSKGIIHVQIAKNGHMAFAAYDAFDRECVVAYAAVSAALLDELMKAKVLRGYCRVTQPPSSQNV